MEKGEEKKRVIGVVLVGSQGKQNEASFPAQGYTKLSHYTHSHTHTHTHTIPNTNLSILKPGPDCTHWREFQIWLNVDAAHMSSQAQHSPSIKRVPAVFDWFTFDQWPFKLFMFADKDGGGGGAAL